MDPKHKDIIAGFAGRRLAVVGDSMVDRFLWGRVDRISPEAPVPVVRLERETVKLGGAANVAANIRALGAEVTLYALCGRDEAAASLRGLLAERGIDDAGLVEADDRPTTIKTRIIAHNQQVVRADREDDSPVDDGIVARLLESFTRGGAFDGVVISDYGKGLLTNAALAALIARGRELGAPVVVDPKRGDYSQYRGATSLTPNQKEAEQACALVIRDGETLRQAGRALLARTEADAILITRGEHGMALFQKDGHEHHLPTEATTVYDVTGAGDTVIAAYTTALAAGAGFADAAFLSNHAAGVAVRELGTAAVTADQLRRALRGDDR
ncbi:MAG TPA: D-glycero-beta-D-manno-heptose-7-phosphate kinase [Candidatus Krumholzibacteria bacterium]|nr:D-glycero-beta-D-manno-heptose-7-phosphate kinase [Candidatus Krumholzibacteria bacterium]